MNVSSDIDREQRLAGEDRTWEDGDRRLDSRLIDGYARDLASAPLLDREIEAGHARDLEEAREALAALVLDLPGEVRESILDPETPGPEAGRKWPLKQLDACCDALSRCASDPDALGLRGMIFEMRHHKRRLDRARDALIVGNLRLVVHLAKEYHSYNISFMDLVQEGNLGLIEAVERFECERGLRFGTYAAWWIRRSILLAFAEKSGIIRTSRYMTKRIKELQGVSRDLAAALGRHPTAQEIADRMRIPVSKVDQLRTMGKEPRPLESTGPDGESKGILKSMPDFTAPNPLATILSRERRDKILAAVSLLEPREKTVLELRFGIGGKRRRTLKEIGKILRVSRERVRQIERLAMARLLSHPDTRDLR
jgi:RNA polymerase sigma factor (sigma-70 family)